MAAVMPFERYLSDGGSFVIGPVHMFVLKTHRGGGWRAVGTVAPVYNVWFNANRRRTVNIRITNESYNELSTRANGGT